MTAVSLQVHLSSNRKVINDDEWWFVQPPIPGTIALGSDALPTDRLLGFLKAQLPLPATASISSVFQVSANVCWLLALFTFTDRLRHQFDHGQSNPSFYLKIGDDELVLRTKPKGALVGLCVVKMLCFLLV